MPCVLELSGILVVLCIVDCCVAVVNGLVSAPVLKVHGRNVILCRDLRRDGKAKVALRVHEATVADLAL